MSTKRGGLAAFGFVAKKQKKQSCFRPSASASTLSEFDTTSSSNSKHKVFCDLDGVLVDFASGVSEIFNGRGPSEIPNQGHMWGAISRQPSFYENLPWTKDGRKLWDSIKHLMPNILTGVPNSKKSRTQKATWCRRELGVETNHVDMAGKKRAHEVVEGRMKSGVVNVITCWSRNKHRESRDMAVLIDDRESFAQEWEKEGGIFIHHTCTEDTLAQLRKHGILGQEEG
mmetsp:Transcript_31910/g.95532  ORF Transcript_31910/g.95532 Transcript_31910/m.95532 type:complete len:228 (-) Transcript_31910:314-997(-)